jgi:PAS domain S-box-containing protein
MQSGTRPKKLQFPVSAWPLSRESPLYRDESDTWTLNDTLPPDGPFTVDPAMRNDPERGGPGYGQERFEDSDAASLPTPVNTSGTPVLSSPDKFTILVIEDNPHHAELISRAFSRSTPGRYILKITISLREAKEALLRSVPALIIADWKLPDGMGTEILDWPGIGPTVPVIIITSHGNEQVAVEAMKKGALDYVVKSPGSFNEIVHITERALREWSIIQKHALAESSLRRNEKKYRELFNNVGEAIFLFPLSRGGLTAPFIEVNGTACQWLSYSHDELLQKRMSDIIPEHYIKMHQESIRELPPDGSVILQGELVRRDATRIPVELNVHTFYMEGEKMVLAIARDIAERVEMERQQKAALVQIEQNLQQMLLLNDQIRNPLTVIVGLAEMLECVEGKKIIEQAMQIDTMVTLLDKGWIESEKVHKFLVKNRWTSDNYDQQEEMR